MGKIAAPPTLSISSVLALAFGFLISATASEAVAQKETSTAISVSCGSVGIEFQVCESGVRAWEAATGHHVQLVSTPNDSNERLALYQQLLAAKSGDIDWKGNCPKCNTALHCCKQCSHFEPSTRFQCVKPIPVRIPVKDQSNSCELFKPRVTVARDAANSQPPASNGLPGKVVEPRSVNDARAAFDSLFKK